MPPRPPSSLAPQGAYTRIRHFLLPLALLLLGCSAAAGAPPRPGADRQLRALEAAVAWPAPDDAVVLSLAARYLAAREDDRAFHTFAARAAAEPGRPLFLALQGLFQARLAGQVFLLRRVAWVEEATARLDRAAAQDGLSRVVRGLTLARLPARFHRADDAVADLRWSLAAPESPLQRGLAPNIAAGLRRAAWHARAFAHATAGRPVAWRVALRGSGATHL